MNQKKKLEGSIQEKIAFYPKNRIVLITEFFGKSFGFGNKSDDY
ncbi:MAG: hypothetical protein RL407_1849 [Bacteroidota bacterium]|jgi:hypothetical protein